MIIVVKPYLFLRDILGFTSQEIDLPEEGEKTVWDLLSVLRQCYQLPDRVDITQGQLVLFAENRPVGLVILINGRNIGKLSGLNTVLKEGDQVTLFPPAAGG
jgi:sulfur-carrier protein